MTFKEKMRLDAGEKMQVEILKKFSGEKRVYLGAELYEMVNQLIKDGIRHYYVGLDDKEISERAKEIISPWSKKKH